MRTCTAYLHKWCSLLHQRWQSQKVTIGFGIPKIICFNFSDSLAGDSLCLLHHKPLGWVFQLSVEVTLNECIIPPWISLWLHLHLEMPHTVRQYIIRRICIARMCRVYLMRVLFWAHLIIPICLCTLFVKTKLKGNLQVKCQLWKYGPAAANF